MKRDKIKLLTVILALLLLLSGCINPDPEDEGPTAPVDVSQIDKNSIGSYKTMQYTYLTDVDPATLTTGFDPTYLLLVNKQSELDVGYVPANLVTLTCATTRSMQLEARAAQALYAMMAEMNAAGIKDVMVTSAYRSYEYQQDLYDKYLNDERRGISEDASRVLGEEYIKANYLDKKIFKLSFEDALKVVQSYSALPGQSEHQTGLCLDFITSDMGGELTEAFENTQAFAWLAENAYKFGFILRYPKGMEGITGYTYEPWHYRFVGREAATDIHVGNMTLEQYLQLAAQ